MKSQLVSASLEKHLKKVWKLLEAESGSSRINEEISGILRNLQKAIKLSLLA